LKELGLSKHYLYALAKDGLIEQVGRGLYQWSGSISVFNRSQQVSLWLCCVFRPIMNTHSDSRWTLIPNEDEHPFRFNLNTHSGLKMNTFRQFLGIGVQVPGMFD